MAERVYTKDWFLCRCQDRRIKGADAVVLTGLEIMANDCYCPSCGEDALVTKCWCGRVVDELYVNMAAFSFGRTAKLLCDFGAHGDPKDMLCEECVLRYMEAAREWHALDIDLEGTFGIVEPLDMEPWPENMPEASFEVELIAGELSPEASAWLTAYATQG